MRRVHGVMSRALCLATVLLALAWPAVALGQTGIDQTRSGPNGGHFEVVWRPFTATATSGEWIDITRFGLTNHAMAYSTVGTVASIDVRLQCSRDGGATVAEHLLTLTTVSGAVDSVSDKVCTHIRARVETLTGGSSIRVVVVYRGDMKANASGGGGAGDASAANQTTMIGHVDGLEGFVDGLEGLLTTIADATQPEDSVWDDNDRGMVIFGVMQVAQSDLCGDGQLCPWTFDNDGGARVHVMNGAAGGSSHPDDDPFTMGTTSFTGVGGVLDEVGSATCTENSACIARVTTNRAVFVNVRNATTGAEVTFATDVLEDALHASGAAGPQVLGVRRNVAASSSATDAENVTFNMDALGLLWMRQLDPCSGVAKTVIPIDISTATTTEITPALAGASTHYYICSLNLVTDAANDVALVDDDTDNCASVTSGLAGGATAAEGWNFGASGGLPPTGGNATIYKTNGTNRVVCLITSAATQLSGAMVVTAAP